MWAAPALLAVLLLLPLAGGTPASRILDQLKSAVTRPVPTVPRREALRPDMIWVPDRYVSIPGSGEPACVPGHWERRLSEREYFAPPLPICGPEGSCVMAPAGVREPPASRLGP
jgi:hypothetical protein